MTRITTRCIILCGLCIMIPVALVAIPVFQWIDSVLLIYLWLLFHPFRPVPWLWRISWLVVAQSLSPVLPFGTYLIAGLLLTAFIRTLQRTYVGHTHPFAFIVLLSGGIIVWDGSIQIILWLTSVAFHTPSLLLPFLTLSFIIVREIVGVIVVALFVLFVRSRFFHETIEDTLRQYYEHLQELHFRPIG